MNVIVSNEQQEILANLDVDIIKNISGQYSANEIVEMFKNFFYSKMILDVTSLKGYTELKTYEELKNGLDVEKIIFFLPDGSSLCTSNFLAHLIQIGIYNFTTNLEGIKYLIKKPNTIKDVEHILKLGMAQEQPIPGGNTQFEETAFKSEIPVANVISEESTIIGFKNITEHAGATTLIYMVKNELINTYGKEGVMCLELDKNDFQLFNDKSMASIKNSQLKQALAQLRNVKVILVDLNGIPDDSFCNEVLYLVEPSTIKLNKLIRRNREILGKLRNCKVVLNKSLLQSNDVADFESEANLKVYYNMPPLDERKRNGIINDLLVKLGLLNSSSSTNENQGRIFGLFRR